MPASYRSPTFLDDLVMVGVNLKKSGKEIVEKASFPQLEAAYSSILRVPAVRGLVVLQTCNRFEAYVMTTNKNATIESVKSVIEARAGEHIPEEKFDVKIGIDAARHLFRVASGLESLVLGEGDILRQVREAMEYSIKNGYIDKALKLLFEEAVKVGKRVRRETELGKGNVGIPSASVALLSETLGDLKGKRVLVIGAGMAGEIIAKNLSKKGAEVWIANRTLEKAEALAREVGGKAFPLSEVPNLLKEVDAVISAIPSKVIDKSAIEELRKPLVIIDIAEPPSVDPEVAKNPLVTLKDMYDVAEVANRNVKERMKEVSKAEAIIEEELNKLMNLNQKLLGDKILKELMERAEQVRVNEVERAKRKVPREYWPVLEKMSKSMVKKIMKDFILRIKEASVKGDLQLLRLTAELFGLKDSLSELELVYEYNGFTDKAIQRNVKK